MALIRCGWVPEGDALYRNYHDLEWGVPVHDDATLYEFLLLEGAQAGLSWSTILHKRENYRRAFEGFVPEKVAGFDEARIARLLQDPGIVRNRLKVHSAVRNAGLFLKVQKEFGSFDDFLWRFVDGRRRVNHWKSLSQIPARTAQSDALSKDLKRRGFSFVGSTICYAFMQAVGMVDDHLVECDFHSEKRTRRGGRRGGAGRSRSQEPT